VMLTNRPNVIRELIVDRTFYFSVDEYVQTTVLQRTSTPLYFDDQLTQVARSTLERDGVHRVQEADEGARETTVVQRDLFGSRVRDAVAVSDEELSRFSVVKDHESPWFELAQPIDNTNNELGVYTNSDPFTHAQFGYLQGNLYVRFQEYTWENHQTRFILADYWDAYHTFAHAPGWVFYYER